MLETRTHWIPVAELTTEDDIAGFGPVQSIREDRHGVIVVGNVFGCHRRYAKGGTVQLYDGVFTEAGRRISMSPADYRQACKEGRG